VLILSMLNITIHYYI